MKKDDEFMDGEVKRIVHILYHGQTLCGFGVGKFPGQWPPGHIWEYMINKHKASCKKCIELSAKYEAKF